ncbi:MAG: FHA domain-containing protein [Xanthomonadales bacterium]|nr:FHA domain-containing protein [Xanthomonadales bacterium]
MRIVVQHLSEIGPGRLQACSAEYYQSLLIGRGSLCEIDFRGNRRVSRTHAIIEWNGDDAAGTLRIRDLDSTNGTYVNGQRVEGEARLAGGDRIRLGTRGPEMEISIKRGTGEYAVENPVHVPAGLDDSAGWPCGISY